MPAKRDVETREVLAAVVLADSFTHVSLTPCLQPEPDPDDLFLMQHYMHGKCQMNNMTENVYAELSAGHIGEAQGSDTHGQYTPD